MHVTLVQISVKPEHIQDFIAASQANHLASVREPGNLRFDVLQSSDDPSQFILYEAYAHAADAAAHKQTAHYLAWRDTVADWMTKPRQGIPYTGLFPTFETST
jgi:autoinducer 2-degrading protein